MVVVASCHWDSRYTPIWKGWGVWSPPRACDPAIPYPTGTSNPARGRGRHRLGSAQAHTSGASRLLALGWAVSPLGQPTANVP
jgi:hypothetical protein